jgi:carboxylesterase
MKAASSAETYAEALTRIEELRSRDGSDVRPGCGTYLLDHGKPTARAIIVLHGMTNCPRQFRFPSHGLLDRMTDEQAGLTARELTVLADETVSIAQGLGEAVIIVGLSIGGTVAAWCAHHRSDIEKAALISPLFGLRVAPTWATEAISHATRMLPNFHMWWDPIRRENMDAPKHVYPRFASRALGELLGLAIEVREKARRDPPAAQSLLVVTVANDMSVNNEATEEIVQLWNSHGSKPVETFEFAKELDLDHDLIDPDQSFARPDLVYPTLLELILGDEV